MTQRIGVVGGGLMGSGIAEVCARSGRDVVVVEANAPAAEAAQARIEKSLRRAAERGKIDDPEAVLGRIRFATELDDLADRELVIEAIVENEEAKTDLFSKLDKIVQPDAILASNTSSIPIMKLAVVTQRPQQVLGIHFFNPVPVLKLVELVPSLMTSEETTARSRAFVEEALGKQAILCQDRAGFVVNALLIPFILSAIRMMESGFATAEDIDHGLVLGAAHPQGPLALADLIGLDTTKAVAESLYEEFKEPLYAPPPLLAADGRCGPARPQGRARVLHVRPLTLPAPGRSTWVGQPLRRLQAEGVGQQLGQLVPVGVVVEDETDDVAAPLALEVRRAQVFERQHLIGLGAERDPEQPVLAAEHVGHRGLADSPAHARPGRLLVALREALEDSPQPLDPRERDVRAVGHQTESATATRHPHEGATNLATSLGKVCDFVGLRA